MLALLLPALPGCPPTMMRDRVARQDVESLQTNVQQMESSLQVRQAGVYEQIRDLRETQSRLERVIEENAREAKNIGQQLERLRERTQEDLERRDQAQREAAQADAERLTARFDTVQKGLQTVNDNLLAMSEFEKRQEERIVKMREQSQAQLKVVVDEVGKENQGLTRALASVRTDLEGSRQEAALTRQGLTALQEAMQQIAERLAATQVQMGDLGEQLTAAQGQIRDLQRGEQARKAAAARPDQHIVRAGETLTSIAAQYEVRVKDLMELNKISDADIIREGKRLSLPKP